MKVRPLIARWKSIRRFSLPLLVVVGTCAAALIIIPALLRSPADEVFRWFRRLGFPDLAGRAYVKVATGGWSQSGNDAPQGDFTQGFLLSQSNDTFTVLTRDLSVRTFHATAPGTPAHKQVAFERLDLPKEASSY